jgi:hypothetical protein
LWTTWIREIGIQANRAQSATSAEALTVTMSAARDDSASNGRHHHSGYHHRRLLLMPRTDVMSRGTRASRAADPAMMFVPGSQVCTRSYRRRRQCATISRINRVRFGHCVRQMMSMSLRAISRRDDEPAALLSSIRSTSN